MRTLGQKIKELRNALSLTQAELAEEIDISLKSLQRYEKEQSKPDFYALTRLATFFDVSADYLLGISSLEEEIEITENRAQNLFYKQYIKCRNNYEIDQNAVYYWIEALGDKIGGQTEFCGWTESGGRKKEIRRLREVIPEGAIALCSSVKGKPMVLNSEEDAIAFLVFGGQAIAKREVCEKYLPWFLKDFVAE